MRRFDFSADFPSAVPAPRPRPERGKSSLRDLMRHAREARERMAATYQSFARACYAADANLQWGDLTNRILTCDAFEEKLRQLYQAKCDECATWNVDPASYAFPPLWLDRALADFVRDGNERKLLEAASR